MGFRAEVLKMVEPGGFEPPTFPVVTGTRRARMKFGGAGGIRTPDLLDAIEARCQLRYGPTAGLVESYSSKQEGSNHLSGLMREKQIPRSARDDNVFLKGFL